MNQDWKKYLFTDYPGNKKFIVPLNNNFLPSALPWDIVAISGDKLLLSS